MSDKYIPNTLYLSDKVRHINKLCAIHKNRTKMIDENQILYIENIELKNLNLSILLHKNMPPYYFDKYERKPYVKILIENFQNNISEEKIEEFINPYNDGIFFKISNDKKSIKFKDLGSNEAHLSGKNIYTEEIEYSNEQLWSIIFQLDDLITEYNGKFNEQNSIIDKTLNFAEKEIDKNEKLLSQLSEAKTEIIEKTKIKIDCWTKIKNSLKQK